MTRPSPSLQGAHTLRSRSPGLGFLCEVKCGSPVLKVGTNRIHSTQLLNLHDVS